MTIARVQGAAGFGPISSAAELRLALKEAVQTMRAGMPVVVHVRVAPY